ncbi:hypothetical protein [Brachybacterium subflavum]|uniref:hypothetical protein n=1 Tax=Brachybacterium subflavum TaxID=2585206 RepID=UPI0012663369|nr:hypothetical protein [Brachybacterium subflavum]
MSRSISLTLLASLLLGGALALGPTSSAHADPTTPAATSEGRPEFTPEPVQFELLPGGGGVEAVPLEWPEGTTMTYQWNIDGEPMPGKTGTTFLFDQPWYGDKDLTLTVIASNPGYQTASFTSPARRIADSDIRLNLTLDSSIPVITGLQDGNPPQVHQVLSAATGRWTAGTTFAYQWLADGEPIAGATKRDFTVTSDQVGAKLSVEIVGSKTDYTTNARVSSETPSVPTSVTPRVVVSGSATVGATLKADVGSWPGWKAAEFYWKVDGVDVRQADVESDSYVLTTDHVGHEISVSTTWFHVGDSAAVFDPVSIDSDRTAKVAGLAEQTAGTVTIAGTPQVGKTIVADTAGWGKGSKLSYQWFADGELIPDQTEDRIKVPRDVAGKRITVKVTGVLAGHTDRTAESDPTPAATLPALSSGSVKVTGSGRVGSTLTAETARWPEGTGLTYQWVVSGLPDGGGYTIPGATGPTLTLTPELEDGLIEVYVKGVHDDYSSSTASAFFAGRVLPEAQHPSATTVTGTLRVGEKVTAVPHDWARDTRYEYVWAAGTGGQLEWLEGDGGPSLTITPDLAGKQIGVLVIGAHEGLPEKRYSTLLGEVEQGALDVSTPEIAGTPTVGHTLSAMPGQWTKGTALSYQWYADGAALDGATSAKLAVTPDHLGKQLSVAVTGELDGYVAAQRTSKATAPVAAGSMTGPTPGLSGSSRVGQTIIATAGTWPKGAKLAYQWKANGVSIKGATKSSMAVAPSLKGKRLTVTVTGKQAGYANVSHTSRVSKPVAAGTMISATPGLSGSSRIGQKIYAKPGTWSKGAKLSYQWNANDKAINGATKPSMTVTPSLKGKRLSVTVIGRLDGYTTISHSSRVSKPVSLGILTASTPKISGTVRVGSKLAAKAGSWSSGTKFSYQWYANGKPIKGAAKSTLVLDSSQKGKTITVKVKGSKSGYNTVSKSSGKTAKVAARR